MRRRFFLVILALLMLFSTFAPSAVAVEAKKSALKLKARKTLTVTEGESWGSSIKLKMSDNGRFPADVVCTVKNPDVARVEFDKRQTNADDDYAYYWSVIGEKPGTTTVTFSSQKLGSKATAKCKITVKANVYSRKKPYAGKKKGVYTSPKKMYFTDDELIVDMFIYNKSGKAITMIQGLCVALVGAADLGDINNPFEDGVVYEYGDWVPNKGQLKNNKYAVVRFILPYPKNYFELRLSIPEVVPFVGYYGLVKKGIMEKGIGRTPMLNGLAPGTRIDWTAMPEVGYELN